MYHCTERKSDCVPFYKKKISEGINVTKRRKSKYVPLYIEKIRVYTIIKEENQIVYHCTERKLDYHFIGRESDCKPLYREKIRVCTIVHRKSEFAPLYREKI